jgi:hypothetical protein
MEVEKVKRRKRAVHLVAPFETTPFWERIKAESRSLSKLPLLGRGSRLAVLVYY